MSQTLFISVDGGATKCIVRVENEAGELLGRATGGPANIRLSVQQTWTSILTALDTISHTHDISLSQYQLHAGMGLAGCEDKAAYQNFIQHKHAFHRLVVSSDSHAACLAAHQGNDGAIIIAGTGVAGYQTEAGNVSTVSGWGFPHDDEGSGAWMGLEAVKLTLKWLDGRAQESSMTKAIYAYFQQDAGKLLQWANSANSTGYAELAPIIIQQSQQGDEPATTILKRAAKAIDHIGETLFAKQRNQHHPLPCSLIGGVTTYIEPYLSQSLRSRLHPCYATPEVGAMMLVRDEIRESK